MPTSAIDSAVFRHIFGTEQMRKVWSDENRTQRYLDIEAALARELGLAPPEIAWHTQRDRIAEAGCFLGLLTGTLAKFATDVKLLMQTEVGEVSEPYLPGRGSSSTMPQKRNPISCCYLHACAAPVRQHVAALMDAMTGDHERATGPWEIEWIVLPEVFTLAAGALSQARTILSGLNVDPERMRANLDLSRGLIVSEAVMMGLAPYLGRERSHDLVYDICSEVSAGNGIFLDLLAAHPAITPHLRRDALSALLDPANYLGMAPQMVMLSWKLTIKRRANYEQHTKPLWATTLATLTKLDKRARSPASPRDVYENRRHEVCNQNRIDTAR